MQCQLALIGLAVSLSRSRCGNEAIFLLNLLTLREACFYAAFIVSYDSLSYTK